MDELQHMLEHDLYLDSTKAREYRCRIQAVAHLYKGSCVFFACGFFLELLSVAYEKQVGDRKFHV